MAPAFLFCVENFFLHALHVTANASDAGIFFPVIAVQRGAKVRTSIIYHKVGRFEVETGLTILAASQKLGVFHGNPCGGLYACASCMVWILAGEQNCSPMEEQEARILAAHNLHAPIRLACATQIRGPIRLQILVHEESEVTKLENDPKQILPPIPGRELPLVLMDVTWHGFKTFALKNLPYDSVLMLHRFRHLYKSLLQEYDGTLCETNGAGFLAMFGLHEEISHAVNKAMGCARRLSVACKEIEEYYAHHLDANLNLGLSVHVGLTGLGRIGHPENPQWVVVGETRQIAERLSQLTESAKAKILVSEPIFALIRDRFPITRAFAARMPGKEQRSNVFEVPAQSTGFVMGMAA